MLLGRVVGTVVATQKNAQLEGSKAFAKEVMAAAEVPTAMAHVCSTLEEVESALDALGAPHVVKDDGLAAVRCPRRVGQPDGQIGGPHATEHIAAPPPAVEIGQPLLDVRLQPKEFRGLPGPLLGSAERRVGDAEIDGRVDLTVPDRVQRFVSGKPSGRHRVGHGVRHECQPDDLTHTRASTRRASSSSSRCTVEPNTTAMTVHRTSWVPSEYSRNS